MLLTWQKFDSCPEIAFQQAPGTANRLSVVKDVYYFSQRPVTAYLETKSYQLKKTVWSPLSL